MSVQYGMKSAELLLNRLSTGRGVPHSWLESTVRYLGIEVDDALDISEQTEA